MSAAATLTRLAKLEAKAYLAGGSLGLVIQTIADLGDEAEHERQAAEQKRAAGYREGDPFLHIRRIIIDPPPPTGLGAHRMDPVQ